MKRKLKKYLFSSAFRIALIYILVSAAWIFLSDRVISSLTESVRILTLYSHIKGVFFVLFTGGMLFFMINKRLMEKNEIITRLDKEVVIREQLIQELHHRIKNNMQVVLSLISIESKNIECSEDFNLIITNKLQPMMSIFNIVYNIRDMTNISLRSVMNEYVRTSIRNLVYICDNGDPAYSVEIITSLMLVLDSILDIYCTGDRTAKKISIRLLDSKRIELSIPGANRLPEIRPEDREYIDIQLQTINGEIEVLHEQNIVILTFSDIN
jgi:hypothetical protein